MQVQYDKYFDERGQITVFLSLLFLVLMMSFLFIVEGVISYSASSLGEDAVKGAGESIMANYDRELFKNYHLFFLDPRQKDYIVTDGKEFINQYFSGNSFFDIYKDYLKLFLLTKGNSRTVCYRMMDIMQENIASKEPGFLMENCLFSYSWKGSLAAGGVKLNFVKQCSY